MTGGSDADKGSGTLLSELFFGEISSGIAVNLDSPFELVALKKVCGCILAVGCDVLMRAFLVRPMFIPRRIFGCRRRSHARGRRRSCGRRIWDGGQLVAGAAG